ncbi:MAG: HD domain-containing protein [Spirosomataceae bacterium]
MEIGRSMDKTLDFVALQRFVLNELAQRLSPQLTYHGTHHTKDVLTVCKQYARRLGIKGREAALLKTGALVHDIGFLHTYHNHEEQGVAMIQEMLPRFGFNRQEISLISGLIMATKVPQHQNTLGEKEKKKAFRLLGVNVCFWMILKGRFPFLSSKKEALSQILIDSEPSLIMIGF